MTQQNAMQKKNNAAAMQIKGTLEARLPQLRAALPATVAKYLTPERIVKVVMLAVSQNKALLECSPLSILKSTMDAAACGLEIGGPLGQAYMVPYFNKQTGMKEAQCIIGYRGLIALARRSGEIESVHSQIAYENDIFDLDLGSGEPPKHTRRWREAHGEPMLVYVVAKFKSGGHHVEVMTFEEIEEIRKRSKAGNAGPWKSDYNEMARKTVIRRASKYWPISTELADAIAMDSDGQAPRVGPIVELGPVGDIVDAEPAKPSRAQEALQRLKSGGAPELGAEPEQTEIPGAEVDPAAPITPQAIQAIAEGCDAIGVKGAKEIKGLVSEALQSDVKKIEALTMGDAGAVLAELDFRARKGA